MLKLQLKEILEERGVSHPYTWMRKTLGINGSTSHRLLSGVKETISFEQLDTICQKLECAPSDLFYYVQDGRQTPISPEHPLLKLKKPEAITNWEKLFKKLPPHKIAEIARQINKDLEENKV